jgi:hypothetical protein
MVSSNHPNKFAVIKKDDEQWFGRSAYEGNNGRLQLEYYHGASWSRGMKVLRARVAPSWTDTVRRTERAFIEECKKYAALSLAQWKAMCRENYIKSFEARLAAGEQDRIRIGWAESEHPRRFSSKKATGTERKIKMTLEFTVYNVALCMITRWSPPASSGSLRTILRSGATRSRRADPTSTVLRLTSTGSFSVAKTTSTEQD